MAEGTLRSPDGKGNDPIIVPTFVRERGGAKNPDKHPGKTDRGRGSPANQARRTKANPPRNAKANRRYAKMAQQHTTPANRRKRKHVAMRYIDAHSAFIGRAAGQSSERSSGFSKEQVLTAVISFFAALIMTRAEIMGVITPFSVAFFVAGMMSGLSPLIMLSGCALGVLTIWPSSAAAMWNPLICALLWATSRFWKQTKAHTVGAVFAVSSIPVLITAYGAAADIVYGLFGSLASAFATWMFIEAMSIQVRGRRLLSQEETVGAAVLVSALALGLYGVDLYLFTLGEAFGVFVIICCGMSGGMGIGAACGAVMGIALMMGGASPMVCVNLSICGLAVGLFRWAGRGVACLVFFLFNTLITLYINPQATQILSIYAVLLASACVLVTPSSFFAALGLFLDDHSGQAKRRQDFAIQTRAEASSRLGEYASIFMGMSETFSQPLREPETDFLESARYALCEGCQKLEICWAQENEYTVGYMVEMAMAVEQQGTITPGDIPRGFMRDCIRRDDIAKKIAPVFAQHCMERVKIEHDRYSRDILCRQLQGMARSVAAFADTLREDVKFDEEAARSLREEFDKAGIATSDATVYERAERLFAQVTLTSCGARGICGKKAAEIVSNVLGIAMRTVDPCCCMGECSVTYEQAPVLSVVTGIARLPKGNGPCGDSFTFTELRDGRYMLTLCDGMGSGERAARESAAVASMLEQFFYAGFAQEDVFDTVNRLMLLKSDNEIFTTVDMCLLDMNDCTAEFIKIGAERSIIKRGKQVKAIGEGALPLGILDEVTPQSECIEIVEGDMIILFTDGISDAGLEDSGSSAYFNFDWLLETTASITTQNPQEMADAVMEAALSRVSPRKRDDMTVMVTRVYER